jgi:hypothetical protein
MRVWKSQKIGLQSEVTKKEFAEIDAGQPGDSDSQAAPMQT